MTIEVMTSECWPGLFPL